MYQGSGTLTCNNLTWHCSKATGTATFDNSVYNPSFIVRGDISFTTAGGAIVYTKGTGSYTLSGGNAQSIDFNGFTIEDLEIDKTGGTVTLGDSFTTDSFAGTAGTADPNGKTVTTTGACDWASGFDFDSAADCMNGCSWVVGGNFSADSQTLKATASWTLSVTGTATATNVDVQYSDASGGTTIDASDGTCTNSGNNQNWSFGNRRRRFFMGACA